MCPIGIEKDKKGLTHKQHAEANGGRLCTLVRSFSWVHSVHATSYDISNSQLKTLGALSGPGEWGEKEEGSLRGGGAWWEGEGGSEKEEGRRVGRGRGGEDEGEEDRGRKLFQTIYDYGTCKYIFVTAISFIVIRTHQSLFPPRHSH